MNEDDFRQIKKRKTKNCNSIYRWGRLNTTDLFMELCNSIESRFSSSWRARDVSLLMRHRAMATPKLKLYVRIRLRLPSQSKSPNLPNRSKFVSPNIFDEIGNAELNMMNKRQLRIMIRIGVFWYVGLMFLNNGKL